ncbi:Flp family type IVb pilin [Robertmurraya korlensis]|uniref:Flp family type IVb pilin n=1 Tax=Robertmurraya korlensis TaxID=519977 RepID=UPI00082443EF|nr:Flp family type IVb pilin [Robertmurraya korlensis]
MIKFTGFFKKFLKDESGQSLGEYALILGIIAVAAVTVLVALKDKLITTFTKIKDAL